MPMFLRSRTLCAFFAALPLVTAAAEQYKSPFEKPFVQLVNSTGDIFNYHGNTLDIKLAANEKSGTFVLFFPCKSATDYVLTGTVVSNSVAAGITLFGSDGTQHADIVLDAERKSSEVNIKFNSGTAVGVKLYISADSASGGSAVIKNITMKPVTAIRQRVAAGNAAGKNIALNRPCKLQPAPNCKRLFAANDKTKLTDGKFSASARIWTDQAHSVGWEGGKLACVTIDLGSVKPISEVAWCTAGGVAGVVWPSTMPLCVSNDGKNWSFIGDIRKIGNTPPPLGNMSKVRFAAEKLRAEGRFVAVLAQAPYLFCEEIEVIEGSMADGITPDSFPISGMPWEYFSGQNADELIKKRFVADADAIRRNMAAITDSNWKKTQSLRIDDALKKILQANLPLPGKAIMPLHEPHRELLKLNAAVMRKRGITQPVIWLANRWDNTLLTALPKLDKQENSLQTVEMMNNEIRSMAVNISNPTDSEIMVTPALEGFPGELNARLCEVLVTDTPSRNAVSSALKDLPANGSIAVPAGTTRQIWIYFYRPQTGAEDYTGKLNVKIADGKTLTRNLNVRVSKLQFPESTTLLLGGFDYDNENKVNRAEQIEFMKNMYVNVSWRNGATFPENFKFDAQGRLVNESELNWSNFDKWVTERPYIREYYFFSNVAMRGMYDAPLTTERGKRIVGEFYRAVGDRMKHMGLRSEQFVMHPLDEPKTPEMYQQLLTFAQALKKVDTGIRLFNDPIRDYVNTLSEKALSYCDIICPDSRDLMLPGRDAVLRRKLIEKFCKAGKTVQVYSCDGPAKELDPISYHRYQMYLAAEMNMTGCHYWTFGPGIALQASFDAYRTGRGVQFTDYLPFYSTPEGIFDAKHAQAIREGVQDYEYVTLIRKKIAEMRSKGKKSIAAKVENTLNKILAEVSATIRYQSRAEIHWLHPHDHITMDKAQKKLLRLLESLEK